MLLSNVIKATVFVDSSFNKEITWLEKDILRSTILFFKLSKFTIASTWGKFLEVAPWIGRDKGKSHTNGSRLLSFKTNFDNIFK